MTYLQILTALLLLCLSSRAHVDSLSTPQQVKTVSSPGIAGEPRETENFWRQKPSSSYHIYRPTKTAAPNKYWEDLCPSIWRPKENVDVTVSWTSLDSPEHVAEEMILQCNPNMPPEKANILSQSLAESLESFRDFCQGRIFGYNAFKARIVATRGPSGSKCPQWHVDHVPIRWIQSWAGPGCDFVTSSGGVNWSVVNGLDDDETFPSVEDRNRALVDSKAANIFHAKEREAVLLVGNLWNEFSKEKGSSLHPIVHKSPSSLPRWQGRVLLTQDIITD